MMPSSYNSIAHDQYGSDSWVRAGLAETTACLSQGSSHKELVTVLRGHVSGISASDAQRNSAVLKRAKRAMLAQSDSGVRGGDCDTSLQEVGSVEVRFDS